MHIIIFRDKGLKNRDAATSSRKLGSKRRQIMKSRSNRKTKEKREKSYEMEWRGGVVNNFRAPFQAQGTGDTANK